MTTLLTGFDNKLSIVKKLAHYPGGITMPSKNVTDFCSKIQNAPEMLTRLSGQHSTDALVAEIKSMGAEMGIKFEEGEIEDNLSSIDEVIKSVAQDDQLTDDELELIAGGAALISGVLGTAGSNKEK